MTRRPTNQPAAAAETEQEATVATGLSPEAEAIIAELKAQQEALLAQLEEAKRRPSGTRTVKPSAKQQKLLDFLRDNPEVTVPDAVEQLGLGGTFAADSFVWRMVKHGWLVVSLPAAVADTTEGEDTEGGEDTTTTDEAEAASA